MPPCESQRNRAEKAYDVRLIAAHMALTRPHPTHKTSREELLLTHPCGDKSYIASFTKGLRHSIRNGLVFEPNHYKEYLHAIRSPSRKRVADLPLGPGKHGFVSKIARGASVRGWQSLGAGSMFVLQGPDPQAVTMPPPPVLWSAELHFEMAELYWMALLRDVNLSWLSPEGAMVLHRTGNRTHPYRPHLGNLPRLLRKAGMHMNSMEWMERGFRCRSERENIRKEARGTIRLTTLFRGVLPGDIVGPYLSQFLIMGTHGLGNIFSPKDGIVQYGAMRMDQRVRVAVPAKNYMTNWASFLDVQNGADVRGMEAYSTKVAFRFICTGRDLATYVHNDAVFQPYFNACLIMFSMNVPFDEGLPYIDFVDVEKHEGFVQFGKPDILTILADASRRALKAVSYQKFNLHRRVRPEAVGGVLDRFVGGSRTSVIKDIGGKLYEALGEDLIGRVIEENEIQNDKNREDLHMEGPSDYALLPMAFPEGSPMHPSYGSGHATIAGACVTILKAFFDTDFELPQTFVVNEDGSRLVEVEGKLMLEGELNKLCSNISVGRNWAGLHYFSDYYESVLLGEKLALDILQEQTLLYQGRFSMTVPLFDGTRKKIRDHNH